MPKPCPTRWGTSYDAEDFALKLPPSFVQAMVEVFQPDTGPDHAHGGRGAGRGRGGRGRERGRGNVAARATQPADDLDETGVERMKFWIQTAGRYATETIAQIRLPRFWLFAKISHRTREPWHHYYSFLQSNPESKYGAGKTHLSMLGLTKGQALLDEFASPLHDTTFIGDILQLPDGPADGTGVSKDIVLCALVTLVLCNHGAFFSRVYTQLDGFLFKVIGLCPGEPAEHRLLCAHAINQDWTGHHDGPTARKFKAYHSQELQDVIDSNGHDATSGWMASSCLAVRRQVHADTQDVESANKIVTSEIARAPQELTSLISSRLTIKKAIRLGSVRPKEVEANMAEVCSAVQDHFRSKEYVALVGDPNRFVKHGSGIVAVPDDPDFDNGLEVITDGAAIVPEPLTDVTPIATATGVSAESAHGLDGDNIPLAWAQVWNLHWSRASQKSSMQLTGRWAYHMGNSLHSEWVIICSKLGYLGRAHDLETCPDGSLTLRQPLHVQTTVDWLRSLRPKCSTEPLRFSRCLLQWEFVDGVVVARVQDRSTVDICTVHHSINTTIAMATGVGVAHGDVPDAADAAETAPKRKRRKTAKEHRQITPLCLS